MSYELRVKSVESGDKSVKRKSKVRMQKEREEKFFELVDGVSRLIESAIQAEETDIKDLKQITGALKDLKELIWEKNSKEDDRNEGMTIKIEGDVE